jgi:hypothetical protein
VLRHVRVELKRILLARIADLELANLLAAQSSVSASPLGKPTKAPIESTTLEAPPPDQIQFLISRLCVLEAAMRTLAQLERVSLGKDPNEHPTSSPAARFS